MRVTYYQRCPRRANYSIERVFEEVRHALPESVDAKVSISRFLSKGFWPRLYNMIEAVGHQGDINHITGDVYFLALFLHKKRTILTVHDCVRLNCLTGIKKWILWLFWYWLPAHRCAKITVISESTLREFLKYVRIDPGKISVIHDPLPQGYESDSKEFNKARPTLLQIGTTPHKNIERIAQALSGISCHLRIIGILNPSQLASLQHHRVDYSSANSLADTEMIKEYRQCDAVVFASTYEGFGMPIVEGQAAGRPVITSNLCSMPEVAGDAACLVDPFNVENIRQGILKIINDDDYRAQLIAKGYANVERFRPETIARQYVDLYHEVLKSVR